MFSAGSLDPVVEVCVMVLRAVDKVALLCFTGKLGDVIREFVPEG